eukprot:624762-Amphidinium_carterae.1
MAVCVCERSTIGNRFLPFLWDVLPLYGYPPEATSSGTRQWSTSVLVHLGSNAPQFSSQSNRDVPCIELDSVEPRLQAVVATPLCMAWS